MPKQSIRGFHQVLQGTVRLGDDRWSYHVPKLPRPKTLNDERLIKSIVVTSNSKKQQIELKLETFSPIRAIGSEPLDRFVLISFADFRLRVPKPLEAGGQGPNDTIPATARESTDYIVQLLRWGIELNDTHYNFYSHSNSQLKSRTCFLYAETKEAISRKVESLGEFGKIKTVGKKAKRIGLLFSTAQMALTVNPVNCEDIADIETSDYIFTDGCGLISQKLARKLVKSIKIAFRNVRYIPSVFQIRYRGYKGVLTLDLNMKGNIWAKFRKSMKKFSGGDDHSFSVVDYSKPYRYGFLNDEVVLLLYGLGIPESVLLKKQADHINFLTQATEDPRAAFRFLTYMDKLDLAEKVLMDSLQSVKGAITKLVKSEYERMLNKRDEQRCRILVPNSRLVFGVCDAWDVLKEGECAVTVTMDGDGQPRALKGMEILVTRNPCLHPGDLQKLKVVAKDELAHLVDCIVFPTCGKRPTADMMSGGDLDGDTFFVCWDTDLVPQTISQPAQYPGAKEPIKFSAITDDDRLVYFAKYNNASMGRTKALYLDWARKKGPLSSECQELNRLYSLSVDGNRIRIDKRLEDSPKPLPDDPSFILDVLHNAAKGMVNAKEKSTISYDGYEFDAVELLSSRDDIAMSEFELIQLIFRWCGKNDAPLEDFLHLFDLNLLTDEQKIWTLEQLPEAKETPSLIMNALCQSSLIQVSELQQFKLHYPGLRWKRVYDSSRDRLAVFLDAAARAMERFHRKLIVIRVDERLTLAIYVPQMIERRQDWLVDDRVRLFAFPHSQGDETTSRLALPTKINYRLYCDSYVFQLFENTRANTWIYLGRSASDEAEYRNIEDRGDRRRRRQVTVDEGLNFDCRASIALDKFSRGLQRHIGRVNRNGIIGAEIYVISNRDVKSMQYLDLWLNFIDTKEVIPLFERAAREYTVPKLANVNWSEEPEYVVQIARQKNFSAFSDFDSAEKFTNIFGWLLERDEKALLVRIFKYLLGQMKDDGSRSVKRVVVIQLMLDFLFYAPFLSVAFGEIDSWASLPPEEYDMIRSSSVEILKAHVLSANEMEEFVVEPFKKALSHIKSLTPTGFAELVELIALTVRSHDIALDLLLESLEVESFRVLTDRPALIRHFVKCLLGIAVDHLEEAAQPRASRKELVTLKRKISNLREYPRVESELRLDAVAGPLALKDHVRLTAASLPTNTIVGKPYSLDALVESSEPGSATFCCFQALPSFLEDCSWKIENCGSFVTAKTMFDAVHALATEGQECCGISHLIIGTQNLVRHHQGMHLEEYIPKKTLNDSQNAAVKASLSHPLTCLWGPPGTGKTHTIVEIILELLSYPDRRLLITAPTHNAVDNVLRKYLEVSAKASSDNPGPKPLRVSTDVRKVADDLKKHTCDAMLGKELHTSSAAQKQARERIKNCRLIFTTCIGAGLGLLRSETFDTVIIDEASQQTEPASLVPLVKGCKRAVLVGDHVQLGATVQQHAVVLGYDISLFERLYTRSDKGWDGLIAKVMLDTQYRMHPTICAFPSAEFYNSQLKTGVSPSSRPIPSSSFQWPVKRDPVTGQARPDGEQPARLVLAQCDTPEDFGHKSKSNTGQAKLCVEICRLLCTPPPPSAGESEGTIPAGEKDKQQTPQPKNPISIAVLTPYTRQAELLKRLLSSLSSFSSIAQIEISSIDAFQGREADIVIFVTVRCNVHGEIGFLKDVRRLNVVMTRAKCGVVVVGDTGTLAPGNRKKIIERGEESGEGGSEEVEEWKGVWERLVGGLERVDIAVGEEGEDLGKGKSDGDRKDNERAPEKKMEAQKASGKDGGKGRGRGNGRR